MLVVIDTIIGQGRQEVASEKALQAKRKRDGRIDGYNVEVVNEVLVRVERGGGGEEVCRGEGGEIILA